MRTETSRSLAMNVPKNLGMLLLAIWLILFGLQTLLKLSFAYSGELMGALAIAAGILLLLKR
jgi:hypothetical protein